MARLKRGGAVRLNFSTVEETSCAGAAGQLNRSWGGRGDDFGTAYGDESPRTETIYPPWTSGNGRSHPL